jgi:hypothetical protein
MKKIGNLLFVLVYFFISCNTKPNPRQDGLQDSVKQNISPDRSVIRQLNRGPRYSIHQSAIAAKGTYKLDSYEGDVYQMVEDRNKNSAWEKLRKLPVYGSQDSTVEGRPNYQLFLSTIAMRFTYLINVNTGQTWELVEDPQTSEEFFSPISEK